VLSCHTGETAIPQIWHPRSVPESGVECGMGVPDAFVAGGVRYSSMRCALRSRPKLSAEFGEARYVVAYLLSAD
jgi:hypothetical protein